MNSKEKAIKLIEKMPNSKMPSVIRFLEDTLYRDDAEGGLMQLIEDAFQLMEEEKEIMKNHTDKQLIFTKSNVKIYLP